MEDTIAELWFRSLHQKPDSPKIPEKMLKTLFRLCFQTKFYPKTQVWFIHSRPHLKTSNLWHTNWLNICGIFSCFKNPDDFNHPKNAFNNDSSWYSNSFFSVNTWLTSSIKISIRSLQLVEEFQFWHSSIKMLIVQKCLRYLIISNIELVFLRNNKFVFLIKVSTGRPTLIEWDSVQTAFILFLKLDSGQYKNQKVVLISINLDIQTQMSP